MFWVTGAGGCTLHRTGRTSKTISPRTNITCTDTGALGPHLATSGFYYLLTQRWWRSHLPLVREIKCLSLSYHDISCAHCTVSWVKARPLLRGCVSWSLVGTMVVAVGRLRRDVTTCHEEVSRGWECDKSVTLWCIYTFVTRVAGAVWCNTVGTIIIMMGTLIFLFSYPTWDKVTFLYTLLLSWQIWGKCCPFVSKMMESQKNKYSIQREWKKI